MKQFDFELLEFVERKYGPECRKTIEWKYEVSSRLSQLSMSLLKSGKRPGSGLGQHIRLSLRAG
jgi:hypothetical protein